MPDTTVRLALSVKPGSKRPGIAYAESGWIVRVRERAVDGAANAACLAALAGYLEIAPSQIELVRGARARQKVVCVHGLTAVELRARLERCAG